MTELADRLRLLTVKGAAVYLNCTVWCIRNLIWSRRIPYLKLGKRFLIDRADLDNFVEEEKIIL
jgi:excisionase family DNA binding protein